MGLTVLSVGYPFALVDRDPVGGAEQVLARIDRALVEARCRSVVIAPEGSRPAGELIALPRAPGDIDAAARARTHQIVRERIRDAILEIRPDVIHLHGVDFHAYLPDAGPPVLATLHLPLDWYPREALAPTRPRTWLNPVSLDQARQAPLGARLLRPIENGVDLKAFQPRRRRGRFALALGRICPEKGLHHALDAARAAGAPLALGGALFPYPEHRRYFAQEIEPRLDRRRRWLGPITGRRKRRMLGCARCVLVPSLAAETSSLVAREALASGAPVIAFARGALRDTIEDGRTGYLVGAPAEMAEAIKAADRIDPAACREAAVRRFSADGMTSAYLELFRRIASGLEPQP